MTEFDLRFVFKVVSDVPSSVFVTHLDTVMAELVALGTTDPAVGADAEARIVEIELVAESVDLLDAIRDALADIRTAIHAAGGSTPDWESLLPVDGTQPLVDVDPVSEWAPSHMDLDFVNA